jgi:hypothetical protein
MKREEITGISTDICYNNFKKTKLNIELVRVDLGDGQIYYEIEFSDWTKERTKRYFNLHIKEAIELKAMIDTLVYDAIINEQNRSKEKLADMMQFDTKDLKKKIRR